MEKEIEDDEKRDMEAYQRHGMTQFFGDKIPADFINGRGNAEIMNALETPGDVQYNPCPEAYAIEGIPKGKVTSFHDWSSSRIFPETQRDMWIYLPAQFSSNGEPPALMVFNDGGTYLDPNGSVRAGIVFDNLIHAGKIPITIGVFVMPGRPIDVPRPKEDAPLDPRAMKQRSIEYDTCTDTYVRFLLDDLIPVVESHIGCGLTSDPDRRTICGISSGGICAFNAAWQRPDAFGRVLSHCGSFTNIRGGHEYPFWVRSTKRKPIRIFLQSGEADADIIWGSWSQANQMMAASLEFAGYDVKFAYGDGGHNLRHGGAIFTDSLMWLWG